VGNTVYVPGQVQVGSAIQVKLVLEHLVDCICGSSFMGYLELGDLLLAGVSSGVWSDMRGSAVSMYMFLACLFHMEVVEALDNLVRVDLEIAVSSAEL
jgi:hypothetical protein